MHRYLKAVGFSKIHTRDELQSVIDEVVRNTILKNKTQTGYEASRSIVLDKENRIYAELCLDFVHGAGICVRGQFDDNNTFLYEYYFPYLKANQISSNEDITVERHAEKESYAGVCDDIKVGITLIFYLQNMTPYKKLEALGMLPIKNTTLSLSALSVDGTIMMPINKNEYDKKKVKRASDERNMLLAQARLGDEDAIESLTLEDMDTYTVISRKIHNEDVYSLVDTYFMPYGVECDQYSILGEITAVHSDTNCISGEEIVFMTLECNGINLEVCINRDDLYGEPMEGRRFKGTIWLQGYINFPGENV